MAPREEAEHARRGRNSRETTAGNFPEFLKPEVRKHRQRSNFPQIPKIWATMAPALPIDARISGILGKFDPCQCFRINIPDTWNAKGNRGTVYHALFKPVCVCGCLRFWWSQCWETSDLASRKAYKLRYCIVQDRWLFPVVLHKCLHALRLPTVLMFFHRTKSKQ